MFLKGETHKKKPLTISGGGGGTVVLFPKPNRRYLSYAGRGKWVGERVGHSGSGAGEE